MTDENNLLKNLLSPLDILPLVMNDGEISLDPHPTLSSLPVSPIFICEPEVSADKDRYLPEIVPAFQKDNKDKQDLDPFLNEVVPSSTNERNYSTVRNKFSFTKCERKPLTYEFLWALNNCYNMRWMVVNGAEWRQNTHNYLC